METGPVDETYLLHHRSSKIIRSCTEEVKLNDGKRKATVFPSAV